MLKELISEIKYRIAYARISKMPISRQIKIGKLTYDSIYENICRDTGDDLGMVKVKFTCPYDGHVSHYVRSVLDARVADENDVTQDYEINRDGSEYELTVIAQSRINPDLAADASAMSAILTIPTVGTSFERSLYKTRPNTVAQA